MYMRVSTYQASVMTDNVVSVSRSGTGTNSLHAVVAEKLKVGIRVQRGAIKASLAAQLL